MGGTVISAQGLLNGSHNTRLLAFQNLDDTLKECLLQLEELNDRLNLKNQKIMRRIGWRALNWPFETM